MIIIRVMERWPCKTAEYFDRVIKKNNIKGISITREENENSDIAVVCTSAGADFKNPPSVIIINSDFGIGDDKSRIKLESPTIIIDCGISLKSSVTASSITDGQLNYCVQRGFNTLDKTEIPPQEFKVLSISGKNYDIFNLLACITVLLLSGIPTDKIKDFKF